MNFTEREKNLAHVYADEMVEMVEAYLEGNEPIEIELVTIAKKIAESYKNRKPIPIGTKIVIPCLSWQVAECKEICNKEVTLIDYDDTDEVWLAKTEDGNLLEIHDDIAEDIYYNIPTIGFVYVGWRGDVRVLCT